MMIGGFYSGVNEKTEETLIEAAIYNQGSCRRTARRLKIATDAGTRQEKNLDPYGVGYALERAVYLLQELADAKVTSETSDYFPNPPKQTEIEFDENENNSFMICNMVGKVVNDGNINQKTQVDVSSLAKGMYFIRIKNQTKKFVVVR